MKQLTFVSALCGAVEGFSPTFPSSCYSPAPPHRVAGKTLEAPGSTRSGTRHECPNISAARSIVDECLKVIKWEKDIVMNGSIYELATFRACGKNTLTRQCVSIDIKLQSVSHFRAIKTDGVRRFARRAFPRFVKAIFALQKAHTRRCANDWRPES
jgi:hypothetical protein